ncbi:MAG TPA: amidohydrolase family protein [Bryobacteraceae bacterium]|nr:amidohydrolase family protein [Bryobacteraceae bacterium]
MFGKAIASLLLVFSAWLAFSQEAPQTPPDTKAKSKKGLPLKPERKIEFRTDEGTWMSLDISPDGKTIVFDLAGDIYSIPSTGGEGKLLLGGMAFESQPRFSPDGKHVAFISDREGSDNLWIAEADGSKPRQLTRDNQGSYLSPSWTPDGEYVLVSRRVPSPGAAASLHEIWMYNIRGGAGVQVTRSRTQPAPAGPPAPGAPPSMRRDLGVVASRDGRFFYYARRMGDFSYNMNLPAWQIVRRDRTTGDEDTVTYESGSAFRPLLSPDGKSLAYITRRETDTVLRLRDLNTGEDRTIKRAIQRDDQESRAAQDVYPGYAFTPDGSGIVISYGGKIHRLRLSDLEDAIVPFTVKVSLDTGPRLYFPDRVDDSPSFRARLIQQPSLSPDKKRIAFSCMTRLYLADASGGSPRRVTLPGAREYQPAWSPDGKWIAYTTWSGEGGHIWKIPSDGNGPPQQLTRFPAFYNEPVWSPDSERIVCLRSSRRLRQETGSSGFGGVSDLIWIPSNGGDAQLIVPSRGLGRPHFAKDSQRVYVNSSAGLISLRFDGTDRRTHLRVVGRSQGPQPITASDVRIHPEGKFAIALINHQLYLVMVPTPGGDAPSVNINTPSVPVKKLTDLGADSISWADGGNTITWAVGSTFFRQLLSSVTFETPAPDPANPENRTPPPAVRNTGFTELEVIVNVERPKPSGTIVLRGARAITMRGNEVIADADVVITNNRIAAVGKRGSAAIPAGAKIEDVRGASIMPGIVDVHAHWFEIKRGVLDLEGWPYLANLAFGVTTGRDPQTGTNDAFAYQDLLDAGEMIGPRAYSTGPGVFAATDFQSLDDAMKTVARYRRYYRTHTLKSYAVGNRKQRQWMVEACKEHRMMPTTEGALDMKLDFTHAIDGFSGNEHSLPIIGLYKDVVEVFAKSGIFYTPTLLVAYGGPWAENYFYETTEVYNDPKLRRFIAPDVLYQKAARRPWFRKEEHVFPKLAAEAAKVVRAGGRVQVGGHGQLQGIQCHWEMWALASGGLTNLEVLRAATLHGAEALGFAQDLGSIEPGKMADLLVLNKDPLVDIRNTNTIRMVMKNGELYNADTLQKMWPKPQPAPELWWHKQ